MTDDKMSHKLPNVFITSPVQYTDREVLKNRLSNIMHWRSN